MTSLLLPREFRRMRTDAVAPIARKNKVTTIQEEKPQEEKPTKKVVIIMHQRLMIVITETKLA